MAGGARPLVWCHREQARQARLELSGMVAQRVSKTITGDPSGALKCEDAEEQTGHETPPKG